MYTLVKQVLLLKNLIHDEWKKVDLTWVQD